VRENSIQNRQTDKQSEKVRERGRYLNRDIFRCMYSDLDTKKKNLRKILKKEKSTQVQILKNDF
jgi:hypothetical protein